MSVHKYDQSALTFLSPNLNDRGQNCMFSLQMLVRKHSCWDHKLGGIGGEIDKQEGEIPPLSCLSYFYISPCLLQFFFSK